MTTKDLKESRWWESNPQPTVYKTVALPLSYVGMMLESRPIFGFWGGILET